MKKDLKQAILSLRPRDAAIAMGISPRTLWQLTHDGHVRCVRVGTGKRKIVLYPIAEIEAFLAASTGKMAEGEDANAN